MTPLVLHGILTIYKIWLAQFSIFNDTCQLGKNSKNLQLLDVQACNSANKASFQKDCLLAELQVKCSEMAKIASFLASIPKVRF